MSCVVIINKPLGLTPLQAINLFKYKNIEHIQEKISYAGRLDPMAEGLLLLLVGEENKRRNQYENLEKEYEFEVLFGVSTDTYDLLGLIDEKQTVSIDGIEKNLKKLLPELTGKQSQKFPPYSSKPVNGKPLYWWARENRLSEIEIPERAINIRELKHLETSRIDNKMLQEKILNRIKLVKGDFRQDEIFKCWESFFLENKQSDFCIIKFSAAVTSGTYIRSLAKKMGERIGIPSLAFSIKRTRVGKFDLSKALKLA